MVRWFKANYPKIPVVVLQSQAWERFPEADAAAQIVVLARAAEQLGGAFVVARHAAPDAIQVAQVRAAVGAAFTTRYSVAARLGATRLRSGV